MNCVLYLLLFTGFGGLFAAICARINILVIRTSTDIRRGERLLRPTMPRESVVALEICDIHYNLMQFDRFFKSHPIAKHRKSSNFSTSSTSKTAISSSVCRPPCRAFLIGRFEQYHAHELIRWQLIRWGIPVKQWWDCATFASLKPRTCTPFF